MPPRTLIVAPNLLYGEPNPRSIRARRLAAGLADLGFDVEVLTWWSGAEPAPESIGRARLRAVHAPLPFDSMGAGEADGGFGPWIEASLAELDGLPVCEWPGVVYAIGVPVGAIIAGERIAERLGAELIADLGDPWEAPSEREREERGRALGRASALVTTTPELARRLGAHLPAGAETLLAPNGGELRRRTGSPPERPLFVHLGAINPGRADPDPAYNALARLDAEGRLELRSHTTGFWPGLNELPHPHLPLLPHDEALDLLARSSAALVLGNEDPAQLPSKAFEIACTETWALCIRERDDDPAAELLRGTGHGVVADNDEVAISAAVEEILTREAQGERPAPATGLSWEARTDQIRLLIAEIGD